MRAFILSGLVIGVAVALKPAFPTPTTLYAQQNHGQIVAPQPTKRAGILPRDGTSEATTASAFLGWVS
jgi:hypothetical protein